MNNDRTWDDWTGDARRPGVDDGLQPPAGDPLFTAVHGAELDPAAREQAVAAFREARDSGAHRGARTRRRDDWRPRPVRRQYAWRAALGTLFAGLTLGGVAFAVNGGPPQSPPTAPSTSPASTSPLPEQGQEAHAPSTPKTSRHPGGPKVSEHPGAERSKESLCRSAGHVGGKALEATSRQKLEEAAAAQGEDVHTYCAPLVKDDAGPRSSPQRPDAYDNAHGRGHGPDQSAHGSRLQGDQGVFRK